MILIAGHFGNWEVIGYTMATLGFTGYAIAKSLDNPYLNDYLLGVRQKMGLKILDKAGAMKLMDDILQKKELVSFVADQDAGKRGVFVDFFGRKASSYKAPALTAIRNNVPLIVGFGRRLGNQYKFEMGIERVIRPDQWANAKDPVLWITQEYTRSLENIIRRAPEQYLWIYRRWKTRPGDEIKQSDSESSKVGS